jgi:hypothetical protein
VLDSLFISFYFSVLLSLFYIFLISFLLFSTLSISLFHSRQSCHSQLARRVSYTEHADQGDRISL